MIWLAANIWWVAAYAAVALIVGAIVVYDLRPYRGSRDSWAMDIVIGTFFGAAWPFTLLAAAVGKACKG